MSSLTLYYHPLASYCHKVLAALYENGVDFDKRLIDLSDAAQRAELAALWPPAKFPVIRDAARGHNVAESSIIIEYLDRFYPGSKPLVPHDADAALDVRLWDRFMDNHVHAPMQQIVSSHFRNPGADMAPERAALATAYGMLEQRLAEGRTWLCGEDFTMADCAAAPALFYGSTLQPLPEGATHLHAYFDRLMDRPSVRRTNEEAKPYLHMYPFADQVPARFK